MTELRIAVAVVTMGNRPAEVDALLESVAKQDLAPHRIVVVGVKLSDTGAAFSAYRTCTLMPNRFIAVEDAVRLILDQIDVDAGALRQVAERSAAERVPVPPAVAQRATYVFYEEPGDSAEAEET